MTNYLVSVVLQYENMTLVGGVCLKSPGYASADSRNAVRRENALIFRAADLSLPYEVKIIYEYCHSM